VVVLQSAQARIPLHDSVLRPKTVSRIPSRVHEQPSSEGKLLDRALRATRKGFDEDSELFSSEIGPTLLIGAGGVHSGWQIESALQSGSDGVAIGLKFAATKESDLDEQHKVAILREFDPTGFGTIPSTKEIIDTLINDLLAVRVQGSTKGDRTSANLLEHEILRHYTDE